MKQKEIIEDVIIQLRKSSLPFDDLYTNNYCDKGVKKSEFSACIKDLKEKGFVNYDGNFNDSIDVVLSRFGEEMIARYGTYSEFLKYSSSETLYDRVVKRGKNNVVIVSIMIGLLIASQYNTIKDYLFPKPKPNPIVTVKQSTDSVNPPLIMKQKSLN